MIGEYANAADGKFKISQALQGVQYRITALTFESNITRSALAVKQVSTASAGECGICNMYCIII